MKFSVFDDFLTIFVICFDHDSDLNYGNAFPITNCDENVRINLSITYGIICQIPHVHAHFYAKPSKFGNIAILFFFVH